MSEEVTNEEAFEEVDSAPSKARTPEEYEEEIRQLRREAGNRRHQKKEVEARLAEYEKWKESQKSEVEKLRERAESAEAKLTTLQRERLQIKAAKEAGLDTDLADRIRGDSEEDMLEDAKLLAKKYSSKSVDAYAGRRGVPVGTNNPSMTPNQLANDWIRNS